MTSHYEDWMHKGWQSFHRIECSYSLIVSPKWYQFQAMYRSLLFCVLVIILRLSYDFFSCFMDCSILWFGFAGGHKTDFYFCLWNETRGQSVVYDFFPFLSSRHWENVNKTAQTNLTKSSPCYYFNTSPPEKDNYWSVVSGHCLLARRNNSENTKARLNAYVWPHFYTTYKSKLEIIRVP